MKKIIVITLCLLVAGSAFAFKENAEEGQKSSGVEHGHWYKGEVIKKLNYDSLWNDAVNINNSAKGAEVIESCLKAYGGLEHLKTLKTIEIEYNSQSMLNKDNSYKVDLFYSNNMKHRKISYLNDSLSHAVEINKDKAARFVNDSTSSLGGRDYKSELFSYLVMTMPAGIKTEQFNEVKYSTRPDDPLNYIYLIKKDSLMMVLGIDPSDNLIKKIEGIIIENNQRMVFINYFSDFKEYNGYTLPGVKMNASMGLKMTEYSVKTVKINQKFEKNTFKLEEKDI